MQKQETRIRINRWIKSNEVKVVGSDGSFLGIMNTQDAIRKAQEEGLDLVEVNSKVYPPLTRIVNFGKFKYEEKKKQAEAKKKQKVSITKELAFRPATELFDIERIIRQAREFLAEKDRVKIVCKFRGREMAFPEIGKEKIQMILEKLADVMTDHTPISAENRNMSVVINPK